MAPAIMPLVDCNLVYMLFSNGKFDCAILHTYCTISFTT